LIVCQVDWNICNCNLVWTISDAVQDDTSHGLIFLFFFIRIGYDVVFRSSYRYSISAAVRCTITVLSGAIRIHTIQSQRHGCVLGSLEFQHGKCVVFGHLHRNAWVRTRHNIQPVHFQVEEILQGAFLV